jgi:hypothetical protein
MTEAATALAAALQAASLDGSVTRTPYGKVALHLSPTGDQALRRILEIDQDDVLSMALHQVGVRPLLGAETPTRTTLHLDDEGARRLTGLIDQLAYQPKGVQ